MSPLVIIANYGIQQISLELSDNLTGSSMDSVMSHSVSLGPIAEPKTKKKKTLKTSIRIEISTKTYHYAPQPAIFIHIHVYSKLFKHLSHRSIKITCNLHMELQLLYLHLSYKYYL